MKKKKRLKPCSACKGTAKHPPIIIKGIRACRPCKGTGEVPCIQGRPKGAGFERDIANQLSTWTGVIFRRTPSSGGWAKTGDITPKDPKAMVAFPFNIECKNQEVLTTLAMFGMKDSETIRGWWKQCAGDAKKSKRIPLLIFTKAHFPVFLLMRQKNFDQLGLNSLQTVLIHGKMRAVLWEDFLSIPYKTIVRRLK